MRHSRTPPLTLLAILLTLALTTTARTGVISAAGDNFKGQAGLRDIARSETPVDLPSQFLNPPNRAKPYAWWHWMGADFSQPGITKDLEAMKAAGLGGAVIFNVGSGVGNNPWPEQTYRGKAYWDAVRHALAEAKRLGMEISLAGTPGYSCTGGPWVNLERGMKKAVWSITAADGGKPISLTLPPLEGGALARDISVFGVPCKKNASVHDLIDLSDKMDAAGRLNWNPPEGKWKIYRFGYAPIGTAPHPIPEDLVGHTYEVDKLSSDDNHYYWANVLAPMPFRNSHYLSWDASL